MPQTKSAKKALRKSKKRAIRNLKKKLEIKKTIKEFLNWIKQKDREKASQTLSRIYKLLDKAVKVGLIKENKAARKKSRLTKLLNQIEQK